MNLNTSTWQITYIINMHFLYKGHQQHMHMSSTAPAKDHFLVQTHVGLHTKRGLIHLGALVTASKLSKLLTKFQITWSIQYTSFRHITSNYMARDPQICKHIANFLRKSETIESFRIIQNNNDMIDPMFQLHLYHPNQSFIHF